MEEKWYPIKSYEGLYEMTKSGRFRSLDRLSKNGKKLKGKEKKLTKNLFGYVTIGLTKDGLTKCKSVHILLAEHFIENPLNKTEVNHIDGDKWNYNLSNLEWVTREENIRHFYDNDFKNPDNPVRITERKRCVERLVEQGYQETSEGWVKLDASQQ